MLLSPIQAKGALCVGITNTVGSAISRATHCGVHINAGYEVGVASTKAYTSQILSITMMALALAEDSISKRDRRDHIMDELGELPGKVEKVLLLDMHMKELAEHLKDRQSLLFFGRGYNYATALEAALKASHPVLLIRLHERSAQTVHSLASCGGSTCCCNGMRWQLFKPKIGHITIKEGLQAP